MQTRAPGLRATVDTGNREIHTVSGLSVGWTRCPSKRNRTLAIFFPCRSQKASISFLSCVVRFILKKTSLLLSVTLMFKCSDCPPSSGFCMWFGEPLSDMSPNVVVVLVDGLFGVVMIWLPGSAAQREHGGGRV